MLQLLAGRLETNEQEIIGRVLAGNREEFRHLVTAHQAQVFAMIMRQVGDRTIAEELSQDTFIRAFRSLAQFRAEAKFSTWLIQIALNVSRSYFSSRRYKETVRTDSIDLKTETVMNRSNPAESAEQTYSADQVEKLRKTVQSLNPPLRDVLVLCGLEKKSYEEAAKILEIPVGTVRSRLNRARHQLQELYFEGAV